MTELDNDPDRPPVKNGPCDQCNGFDTDPLTHFAPLVWEKDERTTVRDPSFHFDCIPDQLLALLGDAPQHATTVAGVEAARNGVRGEELLAHLRSIGSDNHVEPDGHEQVVSVIHTIEG